MTCPTQQATTHSPLKVARNRNSLSLEIPSCLSEVGVAELEVAHFLHDQGVKDSSSVEIVFRELLANAISHGNGNDVNLLVQARIENQDQRHIKIVIHDLGEGFDHQSLAASDHPRQSGSRKRGYRLIHALADKLKFNAKGNAVTAYVNLCSSAKVQPGQISNSEPSSRK